MIKTRKFVMTYLNCQNILIKEEYLIFYRTLKELSSKKKQLIQDFDKKYRPWIKKPANAKKELSNEKN